MFVFAPLLMDMFAFVYIIFLDFILLYYGLCYGCVGEFWLFICGRGWGREEERMIYRNRRRKI